jgi:hypothetical protein
VTEWTFRGTARMPLTNPWQKGQFNEVDVTLVHEADSEEQAAARVLTTLTQFLAPAAGWQDHAVDLVSSREVRA